MMATKKKLDEASASVALDVGQTHDAESYEEPDKNDHVIVKLKPTSSDGIFISKRYNNEVGNKAASEAKAQAKSQPTATSEADVEKSLSAKSGVEQRPEATEDEKELLHEVLSNININGPTAEQITAIRLHVQKEVELRPPSDCGVRDDKWEETACKYIRANVVPTKLREAITDMLSKPTPNVMFLCAQEAGWKSKDDMQQAVEKAMSELVIGLAIRNYEFGHNGSESKWADFDDLPIMVKGAYLDEAKRIIIRSRCPKAKEVLK